MTWREHRKYIQNWYYKGNLKHTMKPVDLGLQNLEPRRKSIILSFAKRSLADGHFSDLINKRNPNHIMKTRKRNFYEVTHANTEVQKFASHYHAKITQWRQKTFKNMSKWDQWILAQQSVFTIVWPHHLLNLYHSLSLESQVPEFF